MIMEPEWRMGGGQGEGEQGGGKEGKVQAPVIDRGIGSKGKGSCYPLGNLSFLSLGI